MWISSLLSATTLLKRYLRSFCFAEEETDESQRGGQITQKSHNLRELGRQREGFPFSAHCATLHDLICKYFHKMSEGAKPSAQHIIIPVNISYLIITVLNFMLRDVEEIALKAGVFLIL